MKLRLLIPVFLFVTVNAVCFQQIRLKAEVSVDRRVVRLADIASGYTGVAGGAVLARIPDGNSSLVLSYTELRGRLARILKSPVILIGGAVRITLVGFRISPKMLIGKVTPFLRSRIRADRLDIRLEKTTGFTDRFGRLISCTMSGVPVEESNGRWKAAFTIRSSISSGKITAFFAVKPLFLDWRLSRDLPAGHKLIKSDFVRLSVGRMGFRKDYSRFLGRTLARKVQKGGFPSADDIIRKTVVRAGDLVRILYRAPGIEFEFTGRAVESGKDGDRIRVRNALTGRMVAVRVGVGGQATLSGGK